MRQLAVKHNENNSIIYFSKEFLLELEEIEFLELPEEGAVINQGDPLLNVESDKLVEEIEQELVTQMKVTKINKQVFDDLSNIDEGTFLIEYVE